MRLKYFVALALLGGCAETADVEEQTSPLASPLAAGKTTICHATGDATNPFVLISVSSSALAAHGQHEGDIIPAPADGCTGETPPPVCTPGSTVSCYGGPPDTEGVGECHAGTQECNADGSGYGPCTGSVEPTAEACGDGLDNDCDGLTNERCIGDRAWNDL